MGKQERKIPAPTQRKIHKTAGIIFFVAMLINGFLGLKYWATAGDQISTRAVFHAVLALGLIIILLVKVSIVRVYKNFLRYAPNLGIIVFCLAFVVFGTSAGYLASRSLLASSTPQETSQPDTISEVGRTKIGEELFANKCSSCHYADSKDKKNGPGLANLLKKEILPASGRPASIENVRTQLERPFMVMPAFKDLSEQQLADLFAYLKTL